MANPQTGTARFEMQQLAQVSQEAAKMVEGMNVGEISKPFTMINAKGKEICAIVKLKTRLNGHKATITEDYQRLKGIVMENAAKKNLISGSGINKNIPTCVLMRSGRNAISNIRVG